MDQHDLQSDCENCQGICCVAPPFAKSAEFAFAKEEGEPCKHLGGDNRCSIHDDLADQGFSGCIKFECFGAGQKVTGHHFKGQSWRDDHLTAKRMFHIFFIVKSLHWMIIELMAKDPKDNAERINHLEQLTFASEDELIGLDLNSL